MDISPDIAQLQRDVKEIKDMLSEICMVLGIKKHQYHTLPEIKLMAKQAIEKSRLREMKRGYGNKAQT